MAKIKIGGVCLLKRLTYRLGYRPRPGNLLYSPSLDLLDSKVGEAFARGLEQSMTEANYLTGWDEREEDQL